MRMTFDIDDRLLRETQKRATEEGETLTCFLEKALRNHLRSPRTRDEPFRLQLLTKKGRVVPGVNWDDRDSLYEGMA